MYNIMAAEFQREAARADWDELNVISKVDLLYDRIDQYLRPRYLRIARRAYREAWKEFVPGQESDEERLDPVYVATLLDGYDKKTQYKYSSEWERKRDRLKEALLSMRDVSGRMSGGNSQEAREALRRSLDLLMRQVRQMADTMTDEARNQAFEDAGYDEVIWHIQEDTKVCKTCRARNGQAYPIDKLPAKHPNCRCWYSPKTT